MLEPKYQVLNEDVRQMLSDGWSVVGYSTMPFGKDDFRHSVLLQKGSELLVFNVTIVHEMLETRVVATVLSLTPPI